MEILKSLPLTPINYFSEGQLLYVLLPDKSGVQFATFDPNTFESLSVFTISEKLHHNQALIHKERLFVITTDGIIGYDTFTGQQVVFMQTGSLVPLNMKIMGDKLVSLCGIPLLRNKKIDTDSFCVCVHNITGEKISQSHTIHEPSQLAILDGIWFTAEMFIHKLSEQCEIMGRGKFLSRSDLLIATDDYVISASDMGTLEIFHKDTVKQHNNILIGRNRSFPWVYGNSLLWFTETILKQIDLDDGSVSELSEVQNKVVSSLTKIDDNVYAVDDQGNLVKVSLGPPASIEILQLSDEQAWKPIRAGDYLYVATKKSLHQIGI